MNRKLFFSISLFALLSARAAKAQQPADTAQLIHVVKNGDTLWDIANTYLKDPFRWPEIFRRNTDVVENPHWIYPGERIRIPVSAVRADVLAARQQEASVPAPAPPSDQTVFAMGSAPRAGLGFGGFAGRSTSTTVRWGEIEGAPFLDVVGGPRGSGRISGRVERMAISAPISDVRLQLNDHAYITLPGNHAPRLGDRYVSYKLGPELTEEGQMVVPTGVFVIDSLRSGGLIRARLDRQFGAVDPEQRLISMDLIPRPSDNEAVPFAASATSTVLWVQDDPVLPSLQHYVVLTADAVPAISVGDLFALVDDPKKDGDARKVPSEDIAIIQIVRVTRFGATGIVVAHWEPVIRAGNLARRIARIP